MKYCEILCIDFSRRACHHVDYVSVRLLQTDVNGLLAQW